MSKKRKSTKSKKRSARPKQAAPLPKKKSKIALLAMVAGSVLVIAGGYFLYQGEKPPPPAPEFSQTKSDNIKLRETRATLSPQIFSGKTRNAYQVARAIPEVLDRLYCYCRCRENFGHKNLLSCFVDSHAAT